MVFKKPHLRFWSKVTYHPPVQPWVLHPEKPPSPRNPGMRATLSDPEFHCSVNPKLTLTFKEILLFSFCFFLYSHKFQSKDDLITKNKISAWGYHSYPRFINSSPGCLQVLLNVIFFKEVLRTEKKIRKKPIRAIFTLQKLEYSKHCEPKNFNKRL